MNQKITRSAGKHIRQEKARIRREVLDPVKKEEMIKHLYSKFSPVKVMPEGTTLEEKLKSKPKTKISKQSKALKK